MINKIKAGYVSIVGRPNVGKSTLQNSLIEQKVSITSKKRQTTRHNILGIYTSDDAQSQIVFVDTPGLHKGQDSAINRYMNRTASSALQDVDLVAFVVDKDVWTQEDEYVCDMLRECTMPIAVIVNKVDQLDSVNELLPYLQKLSEKLPNAELIPVSAFKKTFATLKKEN